MLVAVVAVVAVVVVDAVAVVVVVGGVGVVVVSALFFRGEIHKQYYYSIDNMYNINTAVLL